MEVFCSWHADRAHHNNVMVNQILAVLNSSAGSVSRNSSPRKILNVRPQHAALFFGMLDDAKKSLCEQNWSLPKVEG